jgi:hypothetical protein
MLDMQNPQKMIDYALNAPMSGTVKYLYHSTPYENLPSIARHGLRHSEDGYEGTGTYFSKKPGGGTGYDFDNEDIYARLRFLTQPLIDKYGTYRNGGGRLEGGLDNIDNEDILLSGKNTLPTHDAEVYDPYTKRWYNLHEALGYKK